MKLFTGTNPTEEELKKCVDHSYEKVPTIGINMDHPAYMHTIETRNALYWAVRTIQKARKELEYSRVNEKDALEKLEKANETADQIAADLATANEKIDGLTRARDIWKDATGINFQQYQAAKLAADVLEDQNAELSGQVENLEATVSNMAYSLAEIDLPKFATTITDLQDQYRVLAGFQEAGKNIVKILDSGDDDTARESVNSMIDFIEHNRKAVAEQFDVPEFHMAKDTSELPEDLNRQLSEVLNDLGLRTGFGIVFGPGSRA